MPPTLKNKAPKHQPAPQPSANQAPTKLEEAIALHQQGLLKEAREIYLAMLATQPQHADALHMLGVLAIQAGNHDLAASLIGKAIAICPNDAAYYSNRGIALKLLAQLDAAVASYDRAIAIKADYAEAYYNRGTALKQLKRLDAAVASYDGAIAIKSDYAEAYSNRGIALTELRQLDAAVASYDRAIGFKSDYADPYCNRGVALQELGQLEAAVASYDRAIAIKSDYAEAYSNRGSALQELKREQAAVACCDRAIAIKPEYAEAYYNRGVALQQLGQLDAAVASYERAVAINSDYAEAYSNRGMALQDLKQLDSAILSFDRAIAVRSDYAEAYWNKSLALLLNGDFDEGWELYEWRWKGGDISKQQIRPFTQPLWLGAESIRDKIILLHSEQGYGDTIQFCRYVKPVAALGARVILEVEKPLAALLRQLEGVSELIVKGTTLPAFDLHCPLLTLPLAFKTSLSNIPGNTAYLRSDRNSISTWANKLGDRTRPRVGIAWSGRASHKNDPNRSIALSALLPHLPDAFEYVSLHQDVRDIDKPTLATHKIKHFGHELKDFADTAALCELMDVVISVDTSVAHLSGALGKRTWVLLPHIPDWRWLLDRDDSPWYSSTRLYRQSADRNWADVFENISADLTAFLG